MIGIGPIMPSWVFLSHLLSPLIKTNGCLYQNTHINHLYDSLINFFNIVTIQMLIIETDIDHSMTLNEPKFIYKQKAHK